MRRHGGEARTVRIAPMRRVAALFAALALFGGAAPLAAQNDPGGPHPSFRPAEAPDSLLDARTRALASQIRCPVCQGLSIQDSPSQLAQQMRDLVRQMLRDGKTPDEVKRYFVARYGAWALMEPPAAGVNWLVYLLPVLALAGGTAVLIVAVRRWTANVGGANAPPVPADATPGRSPRQARQENS